jgi:hypothetical protein
LPSERSNHSNPAGYFFIFLNLEIMTKSLNFNYIYIYIVAVFLAIGCAKESLSPDQADAILAMAYTDNPEGPDPDPEVDCKCYMSITGVEYEGEYPGFGAGLKDMTPTSAPGSAHYEVFVDSTGEDAMGNAIWGWHTNSSGGVQLGLPTPFFELNPPSNGWHSIAIISWGVPMTFRTVVRCYLQENDGSQTLATTTYHSFTTPENPDPWYDTLPPRQFSCLVLTDGGGQTPKDGN